MNVGALWRIRQEKRVPALLGAVMLICLAGLYWCGRPAAMEDADTSVYLAGAKSMVEGKGYCFAEYSQTPKITIVPPLQSTYLAAWWKMQPTFPDNLDSMYAGMIVLAIASLALCACYWRWQGIPWWAVCLILPVWGVAMNWVFLIYWFLSDILFGLFWILLAWQFRSREALATPRWWALTGVVMALMYLTRTAALAPICALGLVAWFSAGDKRWKRALVYSAMVVPVVLAWQRWTAGNNNYATLIGFFQTHEGGILGLLGLCLSNLTGYLSGNAFILALAPAFFEKMTAPGVFHTPQGIALVLIIQGGGFLWMFLWTYGVFKLGSKTERWLAFVVLAYLLEVGLWPYDFSTRGGFAVLPILIVWAWRGGAALAGRWQVVAPMRVGLAALAAGLFLSSLHLLQGRIGGWQRLCRLDELREVAEWTRRHTPTNALVASTWTLPNLYFNQFSERQIVTDYFRPPPNWEPVSHAAQNYIEADYLLVSRKWTLEAGPKELGRFEKVKSSGSSAYSLYRVNKPAQDSQAALIRSD
jgi:hypothetical protein